MAQVKANLDIYQAAEDSNIAWCLPLNAQEQHVNIWHFPLFLDLQSAETNQQFHEICFVF